MSALEQAVTFVQQTTDARVRVAQEALAVIQDCKRKGVSVIPLFTSGHTDALAQIGQLANGAPIEIRQRFHEYVTRAGLMYAMAVGHIVGSAPMAVLAEFNRANEQAEQLMRQQLELAASKPANDNH